MRFLRCGRCLSGAFHHLKRRGLRLWFGRMFYNQRRLIDHRFITRGDLNFSFIGNLLLQLGGDEAWLCVLPALCP